MSIKTTFGKVKGLGSAKSGTDHWWSERITSLALIPLTIWFIVLVLRVTMANEEGILTLLASPFNAVTLILYLSIVLYHGALGMKVVIEDYVHKESIKIFLLILLQFVTIVTGVAGVCALLVFHLFLFTTIS